MRHLDGDQTPERRKARAVLSVREPLVESLLAGLGIEDDLLADLRQFCKQTVRARNSWDVARRRGGLFGARLDRSGAERALKLALADLPEGGEE